MWIFLSLSKIFWDWKISDYNNLILPKLPIYIAFLTESFFCLMYFVRGIRKSPIVGINVSKIIQEQEHLILLVLTFKDTMYLLVTFWCCGCGWCICQIKRIIRRWFTVYILNHLWFWYFFFAKQMTQNSDKCSSFKYFSNE